MLLLMSWSCLSLELSLIWSHLGRDSLLSQSCGVEIQLSQDPISCMMLPEMFKWHSSVLYYKQY